MDPEIKATYSTRAALSNEQIKNWCKKNSLPYHMETLENLNLKNNIHRYTFIYTGDKEDEYNNGHPHHWLFTNGNLFFDSYGKDDYKFPENFELIKNHPSQLQAYDSTVCGEYCCLMNYFLNKNTDINENEIGEEFSDEFGFTHNKDENDKIVLEKFKTGFKNAVSTSEEEGETSSIHREQN